MGGGAIGRGQGGQSLFALVKKTRQRRQQRAAVRVHLDDLQLHSLVRLRALEAVADGFHQAVDEPLAGGPAVGGVSCDVAVRDEFLPGKTKKTQQSVG